MKKANKTKRESFHPLMSYVILILITLVVSGFLKILDLQATFYNINNITLSLNPITEIVESLFNIGGIKYIFTNI